MAISSTRSRCRVESDHQRESAQISADPSSAFDGDGEPRFDAARSSGERLHWRCHHEGECVRFREGPMPACSGTCLMLSERRPSGVEAVRAELTARGEAYCQGRDILKFAAHLYAQHAADDTEPFAWSDCCARTVRKWVRVAREAARS
jgi:hypothetical protein